MTRNQIEYLKHSETVRSNKANEELTKTRDTNTYNVALGNLNESIRANQAKEAYNVAYLGEMNRHNLATEAYNLAQLQETQRHSLESERLQLLSLQETNRSNIAREQETSRHNLALEIETNRANVARERETSRSNKASEKIAMSNLSEQQRYHTLSIGLGLTQLQETTRANQAREAETARSNLAREAETERSNIARETETNRSNRAQERLRNWEIGIRRQEARYQSDANDIRRYEADTSRMKVESEIRLNDARMINTNINSVERGLNVVERVISLF